MTWSRSSCAPYLCARLIPHCRARVECSEESMGTKILLIFMVVTSKVMADPPPAYEAFRNRGQGVWIPLCPLCTAMCRQRKAGSAALYQNVHCRERCGTIALARKYALAVRMDVHNTTLRWRCAVPSTPVQGESLYIDRVATWIVVLVVLASTLAYAVEPLVLYDDFNARQLAQDKWVSGEEGAGTEPRVQIQDNRLRLFNRIYGKTDSDHGKDAGRLFLAVSNSADVTAIKATVQVTDVRVYGCPSDPLRSEAVTFLGGSFFNTATPTPGSDVHDVWAAIGLVRNSDMRLPPDVFSAISLVGHCAAVTNATCKDSTWLHSRGLGPVKRGEKVTFRVQWDRDNHRFIFQRDGDL